MLDWIIGYVSWLGATFHRAAFASAQLTPIEGMHLLMWIVVGLFVVVGAVRR